MMMVTFGAGAGRSGGAGLAAETSCWRMMLTPPSKQRIIACRRRRPEIGRWPYGGWGWGGLGFGRREEAAVGARVTRALRISTANSSAEHERKRALCVHERDGCWFGLPAQTSFFLEARGGRDSSAVRLPGWCCCRLCHEASPEERRAGEMAAKRML